MSFFSKIFGKGEDKQIELSMKELPGWVDERTKQRVGEINSELRLVFDKIEKEREKSFENLDRLAGAELQNPELITRAKQIMAGNRESYIKKAKLFLERVAASEMININSTKSYLEVYDGAIQELTKSSAKSYYVVSEFFGNEVGAVARNIKAIDELVKKIRGFVEERDDEITKINKIIDGLSNIKFSKQQIVEIKHEMEKLEEEKGADEKEFKQTKARIAKIKGGKAFSEYGSILKKEKEKQEQLKSLEQDMFAQFSVLDRALRKYSKITLEENLVDKYLEKAVEALLEDRELKIIAVLQKMREAIERGELELKEKKKERTLEVIDELNKQSLFEFQNKHKKLLEEIEQTQGLIKRDSANLEIKELEYKVEYLNTRLENMTRKEKQLREELEKMDVDKIIEGIKQNIKDVFGVEVVIKG